MSLPRILYAVPSTLHAHLEIAKAIHLLVEHDEASRPWKKSSEAPLKSQEIATEVVREIINELRKAGFNPSEPRVPAGNSDGGQWTSDGGNEASDPRVLSDATPDNNWIPGAQYAANDPPGIGHNQGPPLEEPPKIPPQKPVTAQLRNAFLKAAARWLMRATLEATLGGPAGDYLVALQTAAWLHEYVPYVTAYLQPPETWSELQQDALKPQRGYDIHHVVEQTPAKRDGFPDSMIDAPENLVRISTLRHWQITGWYATKNEDYGGLSPREYLSGKNWDERVRVGKRALILFGVLKP
jgi:hypothetical protein